VRKLTLREIERSLERPRIDLREKVALVDELALLEAHVHQLAIDLRLNRDGGERRNRSEACYRLIDLTRCDLRGADRLDILRRPFSGVPCDQRKRQAPKPRMAAMSRTIKGAKLRRRVGRFGGWLLDSQKNRLLNLSFRGRKHLRLLPTLVVVKLGYNRLVFNQVLASAQPSGYTKSAGL